MFFPKFVYIDQKHTLFSNFACFCTPKGCMRVQCLILKNNPNYVNFFTRMISNFKYKWFPPDPGIWMPPPPSLSCTPHLYKASLEPIPMPHMLKVYHNYTVMAYEHPDVQMFICQYRMAVAYEHPDVHMPQPYGTSIMNNQILHHIMLRFESISSRPNCNHYLTYFNHLFDMPQRFTCLYMPKPSRGYMTRQYELPDAYNYSFETSQNTCITITFIVWQNMILFFN